MENINNTVNQVTSEYFQRIRERIRQGDVYEQHLDQPVGRRRKKNPPNIATNPTPSDGSTSVPISQTLGWTADPNTVSYNVHFGTTVSPVLQGNQASVLFDPGTLSYSTTYYWRIDSVNTYGVTTGTSWSFATRPAPVLPSLATNPSPSDGSTSVSISQTLGWTAGSNTVSYNVYFGTTVSPLLQGNQASVLFDPGTLSYSTTYYWRIDSVNTDGVTTGMSWSFVTRAAPVLPSLATNPTPSDGSTSVPISQTLGWIAGSNTVSYNVYFGTTLSPLLQGNQASVLFDPGTLSYSTTYYWRIDSVNTDGVTTGTSWSFVTGVAPPVLRLTPTFTSNTGPTTTYNTLYGWDTDVGWSLTSSAIYSNGYAWKAFNRVEGNGNQWTATSLGTITASSPRYLNIFYPYGVILKRYWARGGAGNLVHAWIVQGSNSPFTSWVDIGVSQTTTMPTTVLTEYDLSSNNAVYSGYRLKITAGATGYAEIDQWTLETQIV